MEAGETEEEEEGVCDEERKGAWRAKECVPRSPWSCLPEAGDQEQVQEEEAEHMRRCKMVLRKPVFSCFLHGRRDMK